MNSTENTNTDTDERRLWIGNLDTRLSEYQLLKILQKCGHIEKFDLLFHKSGPLIGQPRGYAFVTYKSVQDSLKALEKLSGKQVGTKHVVVRLAKNITYNELERPKTKVEIPVLAAGSSKDSTISKQLTIKAIEAKLKMLENKEDELEINKTATDQIPLIQRYQFNKNGEAAIKQQVSRQHYAKNRHSSSGPYNKRQRPPRKR